MNFLYFFFINPPCSAATQRTAINMYFGGSVVGKASTIGIGISPTLPLIFIGVKKCKIWRRLKHHSNLSRPRLKMQQDIRVKCCDNRHMFWPSLVKLGPRTPEKALSVLTHPLKLHAKTR